MIKKIVSLITAVAIMLCFTTVFAEDVTLTDIDASHWAYQAIIQLVTQKTVNGFPDGTFRPAGTVTTDEFEKMITGVWTTDTPTPISREDALGMLWEHNGKPTGHKVPGIITSQMKNAEATAWGYATGLMQGNDGVNLRPMDTLTRAEAATLIVRAANGEANGKTFFEMVSEDLLKIVWDTYDIFDGEYVATDIIDAEMLFNAVTKLSDLRTPALEVKTATMEDAAVLLAHACALQYKSSVSANSVEGITEKYGKIAQINAAYSFEKGLTLPGAADAAVTKRDIALLLIQLDDLFGKNGFKICKDLTLYPANSDDFAFIAEGIPTQVYTTAFDVTRKPVDNYNLAYNFQIPFKTFVSSMAGKLGGKVEFEYIPSLVCQDSNEAILRVKCTMNDSNAYEVFGAGYESAGKEFYMDIHTAEPVTNTYIPTEGARFGKFICNN